MSRRGILYALLLVAAAARLLLQMAAMPPYAGLDEVYHVARLAFVRAERRNPTINEPSVPPYLIRSIAADPGASVAFGVVGSRWPEIVRSRLVIVDSPLRPSNLKPYITPNYEAQQPSFYYSLFAPLAPPHSPMSELRAWRLTSLFFAMLIVLATAWIGEQWFGPMGILAGALVVSLPTWLTLVVRASNDAFACAIVSIAVATTVAAPRRTLGVLVEALAWAMAIATKLYTWPLLAVLPLLWRQQRASRRRMIAVSILCAAAAAATMTDLRARTGIPLGDLGFKQTAKGAESQPIDGLQMLKITVATGIWTSGQHWDALTPIGMLIFAGPVVLMIATSARGNRKTFVLAAAVLGVFAIGQLVHAAGFVQQARAGGAALPAAGKEGWYWYVLVPLLVPALLAPALQRFRLLTWWLIAWDIAITEGALFHDFAGSSSPADPTMFFRWGPWHAPFTANLHEVAVGPLASAVILLRIAHLAAFFALEWIVTRNDRPDHLPLSSPREDRRGWDGRRLQSRGHPFGEAGRTEGASGRAADGPSGARALSARGARRVGVEPSQHLHHLRGRRDRRQAAAGHGVPRRADAEGMSR